ncbi:MAG TPA: Vms1/Ankzf1 family peptidyl-tRNA hydrolase [Thermoanaerobaculia bacterium]|nr:Vms1/Ankzf1 family peptidyl-tRNA hydrolase [Thermoanaerobaculia bacterium]
MLENRLRELATRESKGPFLSLYLDTQRADESQRDRVRVFLKNETHRIRENLGGNGHDSEIERGIRQIESYMENDLQPETRGVAIFSCPTENVFIPLQLPVAVRPELTIGARPHLRQLAALRKQHPRVVLAMIDAKSARLFTLEFGKILSELDLTDPEMPRRHDQGGWSQANMQRHVQDHIDRHHKEVADIVARMVERNQYEYIILSGQERNLANFRGQLPKKVEEKIIGSLRLDIRSSEDEALSACRTIIEAQQLLELRHRIGELEEAARSAGRGAIGVGAVCDAVNQRRLLRLFVMEGASARGWRCSSCGTLGEAIPVGCPICGESVVTIELVDEFIAAAHRADAEVDFVFGGSPLLEEGNGVGALLRF